jgi:hypothetical protein
VVQADAEVRCPGRYTTGITTVVGKQAAGLAFGDGPKCLVDGGFRLAGAIISDRYGLGRNGYALAAAEWPPPVIVEHRRPMCVSR